MRIAAKEGHMLALRTVKAGCAAMLALALLVSIEAARAQKPSAAALATAKELITIKGGNLLYEPLVPGVVEQAKSVLLRANPMLGKDLNEVAAQIRAELLPRTAELMNDAARIYASRFTEQELKDALAFYKTPLGRKLLTEEANVLDQSMKNAQAWADRLSEEVIAKIRSEMKKRGHEI
jgi:hypothetical protein